MSGHNRSPFYLRFERVKEPMPMQPRSKGTNSPFTEPEPRFRNAGAPTSPLETAPLNDAGATERAILRQIRDALREKKA
jgi:hypothetical protein